MVSWNPEKLKDRLNAKINVSLYSRQSLQSKVKLNEFKASYLSNGEKILIFKRESLPEFFEKLNYHFIDSKSNKKVDSVAERTIEYVTDKLFEITDEDLLSEIKPLLVVGVEGTAVITDKKGKPKSDYSFKGQQKKFRGK